MDYLICLFMLAMLVPGVKVLTFIFGTLALWSATLFFGKERELKSRTLPVFLLLCLLSIGAHLGTDLVGIFPINTYLNVYVTGSGVASIFMAVFLGRIIVEYHKTLIPYVLIFPLIFLNFSGMYSRATMFFALMVSLGVYGLLNKKWILPLFCFTSNLIYFVVRYPVLISRIQARINGWDEAIHQIMQHPVKGMGFVQSLFPMNMVYAERQNYGWVFIHNDFLGLARRIGVIPVVLLLTFLLKMLWDLRKGWRFVMLGMAILAVSFQSIMFDTYKAVIIVVIMALAIFKNYARTS